MIARTAIFPGRVDSVVHNQKSGFPLWGGRRFGKACFNERVLDLLCILSWRDPLALAGYTGVSSVSSEPSLGSLPGKSPYFNARPFLQ